MKQVREIAKMFWRATRDILVETHTIVKKVDKSFTEHEKKQDEQVTELHTLIKDCSGTCPEKETFDEYTKTQNGILLRMEKKYDTFFREHKQKLGKQSKKHDLAILDTNLDIAKVKESVRDIKKAKKCRREIITDWCKYITITGVILGTLFGFLRYQVSQKKTETVKIEKMLEQILKK